MTRSGCTRKGINEQTRDEKARMAGRGKGGMEGRGEGKKRGRGRWNERGNKGEREGGQAAAVKRSREIGGAGGGIQRTDTGTRCLGSGGRDGERKQWTEPARNRGGHVKGRENSPMGGREGVGPRREIEVRREGVRSKETQKMKKV
eukprot:5283943-Pleurochrysis_carterae.AAC.3